MKIFIWTTVIFLVLVTISDDVSARLTYWPGYSYLPSHYVSNEAATNVFINDCSTNDFVLQIQDITISPDIITPGGEVTIEASGTLQEEVTSGSLADVTVKLGAVKLLHKRFDLCDELEKKRDDVEIQCPIEKGYLSITQKVTLPKEVPKAKFGVIVHAFTADESPLACLMITADFRVKPSRNRYLQLKEVTNGIKQLYER